MPASRGWGICEGIIPRYFASRSLAGTTIGGLTSQGGGCCRLQRLGIANFPWGGTDNLPGANARSNADGPNATPPAPPQCATAVRAWAPCGQQRVQPADVLIDGRAGLVDVVAGADQWQPAGGGGGEGRGSRPTLQVPILGLNLGGRENYPPRHPDHQSLKPNFLREPITEAMIVLWSLAK